MLLLGDTVKASALEERRSAARATLEVSAMVDIYFTTCEEVVFSAGGF